MFDEIIIPNIRITSEGPKHVYHDQISDVIGIKKIVRWSRVTTKKK